MSFGTDTLDNGSLTDFEVAKDGIGGAGYQRVKEANPNEDEIGAYGIDTDPVRVRPRRRGTADYDSGNVTVTGDLTTQQAVTASTVYLEGGFVHNPNASTARVTITDTAGAPIWTSKPIAANETVELPIRGGAMTMVGLKIGSDSSNLRLRAWGSQ